MESVGQAFISNVTVATTSHRGFTPEEIAERALDKLIYVGDHAHPVIRAQAQEFKDHIRGMLVFYMQEMCRSRDTTIAARLTEAGYADLIPALLKP